MITARISRMLRELQSEPITLWFCEIFAVLEPRQVLVERDLQFESEDPLPHFRLG